MSSLNQVQLIGNLGADPEVHSTQSGNRIANIRLACSEKWTDKQTGERREKTEWVSVVVFNEHLVKIVDEYLQKGAKVFVQGKLRTRKWTDREGNDRYSTEVILENFDGKLVMLGGKGEAGGSSGPDEKPARQVERQPELDDEIPF